VREPPRLERIIPVPGHVLSVVFSEADDRFVVFTEHGSLTGVEPHTGTINRIRQLDRGYELAACLSPDAEQLALFNYHEAMLVDVGMGTLEQLRLEGGVNGGQMILTPLIPK